MTKQCDHCTHSEYYSGEYEQIFCALTEQIRKRTSQCEHYQREPGLGENEGDE